MEEMDMVKMTLSSECSVKIGNKPIHRLVSSLLT